MRRHVWESRGPPRWRLCGMHMEEASASIQMIWASLKIWEPAMSVRFPILNSTISILSGLELFLFGVFFLRIVTTMGFITISHLGYPP